MNLRIMTITSICIAASAAGVQASPISYLDVSTSNGYSDTIAIDGIDAGSNGTYYGQNIASEDFTLSLNLLGDSTMPRLGGNLQISNSTDQELEYVVGFLMPLMDVAAGTYDWDASLTIALTGVDGSIRSISEEPIWAASVGDHFIGEMYTNPFELAFEGPGTASINEALSGEIDFLDGDYLSVRYSFSLSAGDTVVFGGSFGFVPAPGALAVLGLAALAGRRRRRSASPLQAAQADPRNA